MSTNEFDKLIVKNVSRVSYEYDAHDWEQTSLQLAAARRKKRTIMFIYVSSGIAASLAVFLIGIFPLLSKKETSVIQYVSKSQTPPPAPLAPSIYNSLNMPLPGTQHTGHYNASAMISHKKQAHPASDTIAYNASIIVSNKPPENIVTTSEKKQIDTSGFEQKKRQHGYEEPILQYAQVENRSGHTGINISLAAGVNYGTITTEYAIGATVDKKLSNKFGIEVIVAYVGSPTSVPGNQHPSSPFKPRGYFPPMTPASVSVVTSPLSYLQFAPLADYSLSKKITLSAGPDLQGLLQQQSVTVLYNDNTRVAPTLDLGMLLKTEYAMSPSLKAGLSYRLGANNIVAPGSNYFDRNYMQIQLKYRLH